ncbi:unnamed protein product [Ostreobium quekettii]|uniref:Uncharacterized protein n=1 Tax=Ostreobium quekettii TaxID=121088 RepID=A0A8S1ITB5_9CHLO|nr:unnamed protein product [Ostreobium quekettii]
MRTVEPGVTVFTCAENRVALIPAGNVPKDVMVDYCELLESYRHVELLSARSFYHERQKSPLKHLQWGQGAMHFSFVQGDKALQATPMTALHGCRSIVGVIGICHCPHAPDISEAYADFEKMAQQFPSAVALRCFAFEPLEDEVNKDNLQKEFLIMFPPGDRSQVEQHLEVLMHDFAACVLMGLQQQMLNKSISEMKLQTYVDLPDFSGYMSVEDARQKLGSEEEVKHRRRHTRLEKLLADLSMLAGSPGDAAEHYNTCIELSKMCGDSVWGAAALEGMAEAKVLQALLDGDGLPRSRSKAALYKESSREAEIPDSPESPMSRAMRETSTCGFGGVSLWKVLKATRNLEQQVRGYYMQAYQTYQKRGIVPLQIEVELKRARFVAGLYGHRARGEASDLLTQVMEQWPQLALEEDRVNVAVEAAQVLGMVGAVRKRAWLIWQALEMVRTLQRDDSTLLKMALKSLEPPGDPENQDMRSSRPGQWSLSKCALPHRHWASLHKATLEALLSAASKAGEFVYVWEAAAALLRGHHTVIAQEHQHMLLEALVHAAEHMDAAAKRRPGPGPPPLFQVRNFVPLAVELVAAKVMTSWQSSDKGVEGNGPFIFNPFGKREQAQKEEVPQWIVGEECSLEVYIANPCAIQLKVDRLSLSAEAMEVPEGNGASVKVAQPVPVAVVLPGRTKPTRVTLALIPLVTGTFHIVGCNVTVFGVTWQQRFVSTLRNVPLGPGLQTVENQVDGEQHIVAAVEVLPAMPLLKASISRVGKSGSQIQVHDVPPCGNQHSDGRVKTVVYEGQHFTFVLQLRNHSKLPVLSARIAVQDSYNAAAGDGKGAMKPGVRLRVDEGVMQSSLPLTPDQVVKVPVLVEVGQPLSVSQERASMVETQVNQVPANALGNIQSK